MTEKINKKSECSPALLRGRMVAFTSAAFTTGILLGFAVGAVFEAIESNTSGGGAAVPNDVAWRLMMATGVVMPLTMLGLVACRVRSTK